MVVQRKDWRGMGERWKRGRRDTRGVGEGLQAWLSGSVLEESEGGYGGDREEWQGERGRGEMPRRGVMEGME